MKRTLLLLGFAMLAKLCAAQNFTEGNLVVYRLGNDEGTSPVNTQTSAVPIFLEEYHISGTISAPVQSVPMPTTTIGSNKRIVAVGNASIEGLMTRSADGRYLVIPGYDQSLGGNASNQSAATVNRVVALVDYQKGINTTTSLDNVHESNSFRSATTYDGSAVWGAGGGGNPSGTWYATAGASSATNLGGASFFQLRFFQGNLYGSAGSQIYQIGTGQPTATVSFFNRTGTILSSIGSGWNSFTIVEVGATPVAYVLQYGSGTFKIAKFSISGTTWTLRGTLDGPATSYGTAIEARVVGGNVELYVVSSAANTSTSVARLYKITDTAAPTADITGTATEIKSWPATQNIRGIAWAPVAESTLPVKLTDFKAKQVGSAIQLSWTTAAEKENDYFEVLKSTGEGFQVIDRIKGNGTTDQISNYSFIDKEQLSGTVYYQLKQVDKNGHSELSSIVSVNPSAFNSNDPIKVIGSLTGQQVSVEITSSTKADAKLIIRDITGKLLAQKKVSLLLGKNEFTLPVKLSNAVYMALVSNSGETKAVKFIPN